MSNCFCRRYFTKAASILVLSMTFIAVVSCGPRGSTLSPSVTPSAVTISFIETRDLDKYTRVIITGNKTFSYNVLNNNQPLALIVEIPGANFTRVASQRTVNMGNVTSINIRDALNKGGKQVEIRLSKTANYKTTKAGTSIFLDIEKGTGPSKVTKMNAHSQALTGKKTTPKASVITNRDKEEYVVGGRDVLEITIYDEPDLNRTVRVSNQGYISFPLIGEIRIAGLSEAQIETKIMTLLKEGYLVNPHVSIKVTEYRSSEIYVLGAVNKAGAYPLMGETNLLEALSRAGGIATTSEGALASKELFVIRERPESEGGVQYIRVDLNQLLGKGDLTQNIVLANKDTIYIPQIDSIFVFGEVKSPGSYRLVENEITVLEAITMAGGLTKFAAAHRTRVIRYEDGVGSTINVNLKKITKGGDRSRDIVLKPGDVVVVPQSYL